MKKLYNLLAFVFLLSFTLPAQSILLVNDNGQNPERVDPLKLSLDNLGYPYSFYDAADLGESPSAEFLAPYDLVIWYTGNDGSDLYFWNGNETNNEAIISYLDQGGMMWLQGLDFLFDVYGGAPDTFNTGDFVYDYLGIAEYFGQSHKQDGVFSDGVPFYEVEPDNGIFTLDSIIWTWSTLWYADALIPVEGAQVLYKMGPAEYDLGGMASGIYHEKGDAKIITLSTEAGKYDAQWRSDSLFSQALNYFSQFASTSINVESITLSTEADATSIDIKGGTLQCSVTVLPEDATNKNVVWTLENNSANANIDQNGLLTATSMSLGNGSVTVVATAGDGSEVSSSVDITISNQGDAADFEVLLVNDNANGSTRYLELDTALINLNKKYTVYNTVSKGDAPSTEYLSNFDVVVWYTGNDGADLKLWDTSDTTDYKFNSSLVNYLDNGGAVWLNGLDFFFDLYGGAPFPVAEDEYFVEGQFIYDYMGITKYVAQSKADDGDQGVPQLDVVADNGICELSPIQWSYSTMWFVDAVLVNDNATPVYKFGPSDYVFAPLPFYATVYNEHNNSKLLTSTFEAARMDDQSNLDQLFSEVLDYFEGITAVTEIPGYISDIFVYPNPARDVVTINYNLKQKSDVNISIYGMQGNLVSQRKITDKILGNNSIVFSAKDLNLNKGIYYCNIVIDNNQVTKKILIIE